MPLEAADRLLDAAADERGQPLRPRAHRFDVLSQHPQHRDLFGRVQVDPQRPLERRERELVGPHCAMQRMPAQALDELGSPDDDSRLWAAEQLVSGEAHEIRSVRERLPRGRLRLALQESGAGEHA